MSLDKFAPKYYALIDRKIVPINDLMQWARWHEQAVRTGATRIGDDTVGSIRVSTIFLSLDHGFVPWDGPEPVLFETMLFGQDDERARDQYRYHTLEEAEAGHKAIVEALKRHEAEAIELTTTLFDVVREEIRSGAK